MENSILIQYPQTPQSPSSILSLMDEPISEIEYIRNINRNLIPEFESEADMNNTLDNLLISHFLVNYNAETIYNINPNIIENEFERSLLNLIISTDTTTVPIPTENNVVETQLICLETADELGSMFECGICYEFCQMIDSVGMNCQHNMCKLCMTNCLSLKNTCPFCRQKICVLDVKDPELMRSFMYQKT
jgi:hypothetical protein